MCGVFFQTIYISTFNTSRLFRGEMTPLFSHYIFPKLVPLSVCLFQCF